MYRDERGLRNASGAPDPVPLEASRAMRRDARRRIRLCVRDMIDVANRYGMRVDALIQLTDRTTGTSNHGDRGGVVR